MDTITKVWVSAHQAVTQEVHTFLPIIEGELPDDLRGVLYRNGPGRFSVGEQTYGHLADGDGMVLRFALGASHGGQPGIKYVNRYVRTHEFVNEEQAGRILYRGFGTNLPGGFFNNFLRTRVKNTANTNIVYHAGRLLALWEGGLPHHLDPVTLDTLERCDFDGELRNRGSWVERRLYPELPFAAHPKRDPESGDLYNFGVYQGSQPRLLVYRVDTEGKLTTLREVPLSHHAVIHDFVMTPRWFVFFVSPLTLSQTRVVFGLSTVVDGMRPQEETPTRILLVPRDGSEPRWQEAEPCFILHFASAYENEEGHIVVNGYRQADFASQPSLEEALSGRIGELPGATLTRFVIDPSASSAPAAGEGGEGAAARPLVVEGLSEHASEFPSVHPELVGRSHSFVWAVGPMPGMPHNINTAILRHDLRDRSVRVRDFSQGLWPGLPGEPIMVPRPGARDEDDGYLLTIVYHRQLSGQRHRSALHILDARDLSTVCVASLPHHVPPGFHGSFVPADACPPGWYV